MMRVSASLSILLASLTALGCADASLHKVHEATLLDDKVLQQRVEMALHRSGPDFQNVHVKADSGTAILSGTVKSADARDKAEDISSGVYGVKKTDNEIAVKVPHTQSH